MSLSVQLNLVELVKNCPAGAAGPRNIPSHPSDTSRQAGWTTMLAPSTEAMEAYWVWAPPRPSCLLSSTRWGLARTCPAPCRARGGVDRRREVRTDPPQPNEHAGPGLSRGRRRLSWCSVQLCCCSAARVYVAQCERERDAGVGTNKMYQNSKVNPLTFFASLFCSLASMPLYYHEGTALHLFSLRVFPLYSAYVQLTNCLAAACSIHGKVQPYFNIILFISS